MVDNKLTVAVCTIIKDEQLYLDEWIQHYLNIDSVEKIYLYEDYDSASHKSICDKYPDKVVLNRLFDIRDIYNNTKYDGKQTPLYNYFIEKYKSKYDFALFIDVDEFLMFKENINFQDILLYIKNKNAPGMSIPWKIYGANGLIKRKYNKGVKDVFITECDFIEHDLAREKTIVNLKYNRVEMTNVHWIPNAILDNMTCNINNANMWLNHYFTKSWEEWCNRFLVRGDILPGTRKIEDFFECNKDMLSKKDKLLKEYYKKKDVKKLPKVIISLATHDDRLNTCIPCLKSLVNQTIKPYKIIVNIKEGDYKKMPHHFEKFCNENNIEIFSCPVDLKPHNKYYWTMMKYRNCIVVTTDDDYEYSPTMLEELLNSYKKHPTCVSSRFVALLINDNQGKLVKYDDWGHQYLQIKEPSSQLIAYGCNGVLYPPDCLKLTDKDIDSIKECIGADDIWLKYREIENNIKTVWVEGYNKDRTMFIKNGTIHKTALFNENIMGGKNDEYLKKFPLKVRDENPEHQFKLNHARQALVVMKLLGVEREK